MIRLPRRVFDELRRVAYEQAGIAIPENKSALVATRIAKRMRQLGMTDPAEYLEHLKSDQTGEEIVRFLDVISTNYTYFFREPEHFDFLADLVKRRLREGARRMRMWCAAAATGEEPYSIVMTVLDAMGMRAGEVDFRLLATDISTRALGYAKRGVYPEEKVQGIPKRFLRRYFRKVVDEDGEVFYEAKEELKGRIAFARLNLAHPPYPMRGPLDAIFVRNVMIYFDREVRRRLVRELERLVRPGGLVIVGHAETLSNLTERLVPIVPSVYTLSEEG